MFGQMNLWNTSSATSSPESADGATPCDSRAGLTTSRCGRDHVRASLSARQAKEQGLLTSGTFGHTSTTSSASASLQQSLENKLQALMVSDGSTLYKLTWKRRATPLGRQICALRASAHRISDNGCSGWPTPQARDHKGAPNSGNELTHNSRPLNEMVRMAGWPTPVTVPDSKASHGQLSGDLRRKLAEMFPVTEPARYTDSGELLTGSHAEMGSGGQLNPAHSRWLMGYPPEWDACAVTAMPSSRKSRQRL